VNRAIAWFAKNHVAANLLMLAILLGGVMTAPTIKQTLMPDFEFDYVSVTIVYPGASPEEVEKAVTIRVEEEIQDIEGIAEITSSANEGATNLIIELESGAEMAKALDEIESRVDGIDTFPEEIEEPIVSEIQFRMGVMDVAIHGPLDERSLKILGQRTRDEIARLPGVSQVDLAATRPFEISIDVSEAALQSYGLRFDDVVRAVRRTSIDLPGGSVRTRAGEILLRTDNQGYWGRDFEAIPLRTLEDGSRVTVGHVAEVVDGFEENVKRTTFDGEPAAFVQVYRVGDQQALDVAAKVHAYLEEARLRLPQGAKLTVWDDDSTYLGDRIDMMLSNALYGFLLVLLLLAFFLKLRVAFWVAMGLPVSVAGALLAMPVIGIGINVLTVFAFIMALGILVDDAIVTGENIFTHQLRDPDDPLGGAIRGAQEVATPVVFGVLTTIAAFAPFALIEGDAKFMATALGGVMCVALAFSLIESKLVLPSHLAHAAGVGQEARYPISKLLSRVQTRVSDRLVWFTGTVYRPAVEACVEWRYLTIAVSLGIFIMAFGVVSGGRVKSVMMPSSATDNISARLTMPLGTPVSETEDAIALLEAALEVVRGELDAERAEGEPAFVRHVLSMVGAHRGSSPTDRPGDLGQPHLGQINVELSPSEVRSIGADVISNRWRDVTGAIPGVEELIFQGRSRHFGDPIDIELRGDDTDFLEAAAVVLVEELAQFPGLSDIRDSHREGKQQLQIAIRPEAESLGLSVEDVGRQVRQAFYGAEAQRIQRGQDEVKVMVRYPAEERRSLSDVEKLRIRLPDGTAVPFASVADAVLDRGAASLRRVNRERQVRVTADLDEKVANAVEIAEQIETEIMPRIMARFPGLGWGFQGEQRERAEAMGSLARGFVIAVVSIFILIAVPLRSYLQAIVIMLTIPFGYVGAVLGHWLCNFDMSFLSIIGVMACAGVVVNDSLVLVTFLNRLRDEGHSMREAAILAGQRRFRPIMLTSATTFAGLVPIMLEGSAQAQFVIPMAISLGFGVVVATIFTLLMVPAAMLVVEDVKTFAAWSLHRITQLYDEGATVDPR
jgi:multidrug efflux pump subunit AcrB